MTAKTTVQFADWWNEIGSSMRPHESEDLEEFAKRVSEQAFKAANVVIKTQNAQKVLQLMDKDYSYCDAVALVCKDTGCDREQLEKELDPFI